MGLDLYEIDLLDSLVGTINYSKVEKEDGFIGVAYHLKRLLSDGEFTDVARKKVLSLILEQLRNRMSLNYDGVYRCYINQGFNGRLLYLCGNLESCDTVDDAVKFLMGVVENFEYDSEGVVTPKEKDVIKALEVIPLNMISNDYMRNISIAINCVGLYSRDRHGSICLYGSDGQYTMSIDIYNNTNENMIVEEIVFQFGRCVSAINYSNLLSILEKYSLNSDTIEDNLDILGRLFLHRCMPSRRNENILNKVFNGNSYLLACDRFNSMLNIL